VSLTFKIKSFSWHLGRELVTNKTVCEATACYRKAGFETKPVGDFAWMTDLGKQVLEYNQRLNSMPESKP